MSDFVRTQQLYNYGGIYLDADAVPLRDVRKLRESGFANIVGNEDVGEFELSAQNPRTLYLYYSNE